MRPDTEQWLRRTPLSALHCRDLRHAWPRPPEVARARRRAMPGNTPGIVWKLIGAATPGHPAVFERTMACTGGCGVVRVETFVARPYGLVRTGKPKLIYPSWYRRTRPEPDTPLERLDADVLRGSILARMGVRW